MAMVEIQTDERGMWCELGETLTDAVFSGLYLNPMAPVLVRTMETQVESRLRPGTRIRISDAHNGKRFVLAHYAGYSWKINLGSWSADGLTHWEIESMYRSDD
jgi:hypothetical protein